MPKLFVVMPFGRRSLPDLDVVQDFDLLHRAVIVPAARAAGWEVLRIDEVAEAGVINDQYLREIYAADLLLADISAPNPNVFYEIGLRHAISSGGTLLIAREGARIPFDLSVYRVFPYSEAEATGDDGGLSERITRILGEHRPEVGANPVRAFLDDLAVTTDPRRDPVAFEQEAFGRVDRARTVDQLVAVWQWMRPLLPVPAAPLLQMATRLANMGAHRTAVDVLTDAARSAPDDFEVHRQRGFHLTRLGPEHADAALAALRRALVINPADPEALGMVGGIHKRAGRYDEAFESYSAGLRLAPDSIYLLVNVAALEVLVDPDQPAAGVADYERLRDRITAAPELVADHWGELVQAEAAFAVGLPEEATSHIAAAVEAGATAVDLASLVTQLELMAAAGFRAAEARVLAERARRATAAARTEARRAPVNDGRDRSAHRLVVHLSDVHFGSIRRDGQPPLSAHRFFRSPDSKSLSEMLVPELRFQAAERGLETSAIDLVVSGDLTYTAQPDEFALVAVFLEELCEGLGLAPEKVVLVPGNHDVSWPADKDRRFDEYLAFLARFYGKELFHQRHPLVDWDLTVDGVRPAPEKILGFATDGEVAFVALNSCVYETHEHHYGFVSIRQLDAVRDLLAERAPDAHTRIAVLHHHLHPFPEAIARPGTEPWADASTIRDAGVVERRLEALRFDLVLHGHRHQPQVRQTYVSQRSLSPEVQTARPLVVSGCGSTGVIREKRADQATHYALIDVAPGPPDATRVGVEWRELAEGADAEWVTPQRWRF